MNSAPHKGYAPPTAQHEAMVDLEAGPPLLVGDSHDQPLQDPFQKEKLFPEDFPTFQKRVILVWLIVASLRVMSVLMLDENAKTVPMFYLLLPEMSCLFPASYLVWKIYETENDLWTRKIEKVDSFKDMFFACSTIPEPDRIVRLVASG
jgi:hypothetical protein